MQDFEKHIRQVMQQAEEPVPPQVWDAVSKRLDDARAPRIVALPWRRFAYAVAAAAAVVAGVFLFLPKQTDSAPYVPGRLAEGAVQVVTPSLTPARPIALLQDRVVATTEAQEVVAEELPVSDTPTPAVRPTRPSSAPSSDAEAEEANRRLNELAFEASRKTSRKPALTLAGNVLSNGNPRNGHRSSLRMMTSSRGPSETTVTDIDPDGTYGAPVSLGLGFIHPLSPRLSIGTGLVYTRLPRTFHGHFVQVEDDVVVKNLVGTVDNTQHYLGIPVNLYYNLFEDNNFRFYTYAGGMVEKGLSNHYRVTSGDEVVNWSKMTSGAQLSAGLGMGLEFRLSQVVGIFVDPSLRYYFNNGQPRSIRTQQPLMMSLEAGLRFGL